MSVECAYGFFCDIIGNIIPGDGSTWGQNYLAGEGVEFCKSSYYENVRGRIYMGMKVLATKFLRRVSRHCKFPASCQGNIITLCYNQYFSLFPAAKAVDQFCVVYCCMGPRPSHKRMQHSAQVRLGLKCIFPLFMGKKVHYYPRKKQHSQIL